MPPIFLAPARSGGRTKINKPPSPFAPIMVVAKNHISRAPQVSPKVALNYTLIDALGKFFTKEFKCMSILGKSTIIGELGLPSFRAYPVTAKIFEDKEKARLLIGLKFRAMGEPADPETNGEKKEALDNAAQELLEKLNEYVKELGLEEAIIEQEDKRIKCSVEELDQSEIILWHLESKKSYHYIFTIMLPRAKIEKASPCLK